MALICLIVFVQVVVAASPTKADNTPISMGGAKIRDVSQFNTAGLIEKTSTASLAEYLRECRSFVSGICLRISVRVTTDFDLPDISSARVVKESEIDS